jgi:hypothetical protein
MSAHRDTPPRPFPAIRVGVVGHRLEALVDSGTDFAALRATLQTLLARIQTAAAGIAGQYPEIFAGPARLRVISPLAEGTDQIVAEEALRLGYALHVPLPCPTATYLSAFQAASQATGENPRAMFARLLGQAESVQILDAGPDAVLDPAAYAAVGRTVLRHTDVLIAVWDGAPAAGPGGTGEVVEQARAWQLPVVRIDPRHPGDWTFEANSTSPARQSLEGAVEDTLRPPAATHAALETVRQATGHATGQATGRRFPPTPLAEYLSTHPWPGVGGSFALTTRWAAGIFLPLPIVTLGRATILRAHMEWRALWKHADATLVQPLDQGLEEYYVWAEGLGNRYGTLHRDAASLPYVLAPLAVLLALLAHWGETLVGLKAAACFGVAEVLILASIIRLYQKAVTRRYHDRWIDYRSLAEELRQLAFLWPLGRPLPVIELLGETEGEAPQFAWVGWYVRAVVRDLGLCPGTWTPEHLETLRDMLATRFIGSQVEYHRRTAERLERVGSNLERLTVWTFVCALVIGLLHVTVFGVYAPINRALYDYGSPIIGAPAWQTVGIIGAIMAIFLPALGAAVHGFLSQGDFRNLAHRSQRMCEHLAPLVTEVRETPLHFDALGIAAEKAAAVMRDEVVYWRVFVRLKPPALV